MRIKKIGAVVFSPTESTKKVLSTMAERLPLPVEMMDVTCRVKDEQKWDFAGDELVIFGVPVYGGRIPAPAVESIRRARGHQTPAVLVVVYGNREYDDALLELKNLAEENGFVTVAAAAWIAEHSIMHSVAHGRPDVEDVSKIHGFAEAVWNKVENLKEITDLQSVAVKGNVPYKEYGGVPFKPQATKDCTKCGICVSNCPVGAIPADHPDQTNKEVCISCMRCMKVCQVHARKLNKIMLSVAESGFAKKCSERKEPEVFI